jgi:hypothetical protein
MFIYAPIRRPVPRRHRLRRTVAGTGRTPRRTPRTPLPSPSLAKVLLSPLIRRCDAVHSPGHDLHHRRDASLPLKLHIHSCATPPPPLSLPTPNQSPCCKKTFSCYSVSELTSLLIHLVVFWDQTTKLLRGMRHLEASIVYLPCVLTSNGGFSSGKP